MNLNIAHNPYDPPLPYKGYFDPDLKQPRYNLMEAIGIAGQDHQRYSMERLETLSSDYPVLADEITPTSGEWATIQSWYAGAIRYLDDQLTWIRSQLQARDEWDNTLVIVTADHGEYFGEYNLEKHNFGLYDPVVQIPLVIRPPHSLDKKIPDQTPPLVSLIDLYPTISRIIGASKLSDTSGVDLFSKKAFDSERVVCSEVSEKPIDAIESRHGEFNGHPENQGVQAIRTLDGVVEFPQKSETRARSWVDFPANMAKEMSPDSLVEEAHKVQKSQLGSLPKRAGKHPTYNEEHRKKLEALGYI